MSSRKSTAVSQFVTKQALKQVLQARFERKQYTPTISADAAFLTAGTLVYLNPIAQGDDIGNRNGDTIQAKHLRFALTAFSTTGTQSNSFRLAIFSDSMASGGPLTVTEFLETANYTSPVSAINMQRNRFHIYYDKTHAITSTSSVQECNIVVDIPLSRKIFFNGTSGASGSIGKNAMYALIIAANGQGQHHYQWGLIFQDN